MGASGRSVALLTGADVWIIVMALVWLLGACQSAHPSGVRPLLGRGVRRSSLDRLLKRGGRGGVVAFREMNDSEVVLRRCQIASGEKLAWSSVEVAGSGIDRRQIVVRGCQGRFEPHGFVASRTGLSQVAGSKLAVAQVVERPRGRRVERDRMLIGAVRFLGSTERVEDRPERIPGTCRSGGVVHGAIRRAQTLIGQSPVAPDTRQILLHLGVPWFLLCGAIQSRIGRVEETKAAELKRNEPVTLCRRLKGFEEQRGRESRVGAFDSRAKGALTRRPGRQVPHFRHVIRERLAGDSPWPAIIHGGRAGSNESASERSALAGRAAAHHKRTEQKRDRLEMISHDNAPA